MIVKIIKNENETSFITIVDFECSVSKECGKGFTFLDVCGNSYEFNEDGSFDYPEDIESFQKVIIFTENMIEIEQLTDKSK